MAPLTRRGRRPARRRSSVAALAALPVLAIVALLAVTACEPATGPAPSSSPAASGPVTTPEAAAALVLAQDPRFAGIGPSDPNVVGACCSWTAVPAADGAWTVTLEIGWGDCPAGCINRHQWVYEVTRDGTVRVRAEAGPPLPPGLGSGSAGGGGDVTGPTGFRGHALLGPTCPVVRPNDPACADRPVAGAVIHVLDGAGNEVARLVTDAGGAFGLGVPPGAYQLVADPIEGAMRAPQPVDVEVGAGVSEIDLAYDTGIR